MPGGGDDRHSEQRPVVELRPRVLEAAAAARERERAPLRNEDLLHLDVLAAGADHAHRVPGVDDPVVALRHYAKAPIDRSFTIVAVDRKSTRLNSSHITISYAVFCLKKKTKKSTSTSLASVEQA